MNKKFGLWILYLLLIDSAINTSFRAPLENPVAVAVIGLAVLAAMVVFAMVRRHRTR